MSNSLLFGQIQGYALGDVPAYSSDYKSADNQLLPDRHAFRNYFDGVYTGYKWQCVEFARRWLLVNRGYVFDDIAMAYDIFRLSSVKIVATDERLPLHSFANGSKRHPEVGAMLIWSEGGEFQRTGHVAIITEVFADKLRVAEQNVDFFSWEGRNYSRELPACISADGNYWIQCSFLNASILGWVMQTADATHAVAFPKPKPELFAIKMRETAPEAEHINRPWLNLANPDEAAYLAKNGENLAPHARRYQYFCISATAEQEVKRAVNELHALFMHATDYVLQHEELLARFNLPKVIWPRIVQSWNNRRNQMITGRFDFCLTEQGLKLYEYNCDSASCHTEAAKIQGAWAAHYGCDDGEDAGEDLAQHLIDAWKKSNTDGLVHILLDEDAEELYHALFMQQCMQAAGISSKLVRGLDKLHWNDNHSEVLDADGVAIQRLWKTWAWETALDQLREELTDAAQQHALASPNNSQPRLMDVLFRPDTLVFEPLWTLIPSNKAILPILWELFPNHPYLLNSQFELTEELRNQGYVVKPIVGRCGHNISLFDNKKTLIEGTKGNFDRGLNVYQELAPLPILDGLNVQLCSFSAGGTYAGSITRVDGSRIITTDSPLMPIRVQSDKEFKR